MLEIWKPIKGFCGAYEVSNKGRIRSVTKRIYFDGKTPYSIIKKGALMKGGPTHTGHLLVSLSLGHKVRVRRYIHVLILETFVRKGKRGEECRHRNGKPGDNRLSNIKWCFRSDNLRDRKWHAGTSRYVLTPNNVREARRLLAGGVQQKVVAQKFNVCPATIHAMQIGQTHIDVR